MNGSKRFALNQADMERIGVGLAVALSGAALTYISETIAETDFGSLTPIVVSGWSVFVNAARKWIIDSSDSIK